MKNVFQICFLTLVMVGLLSCNNDDNVVKRTYIEFLVAGPSMNGKYIIEEDGDINQLEATALYTPETSVDPSIVILTYQDYNGLQVNMVVPGQEGTTILTDEDDHFGMNIVSQDNNISLISTNLTMEITRLKTETSFIGLSLVDEMRGKFIGSMVFENNEGEKEIHEVEGDFEFANF